MVHEHPDNKRRWSRRIVLSTGGVGVVGAGAMIYQAAPGFWQQYTSELRRPVHPAPKIPDPAKWPDKGLHAAWLGHSTVLLKIDGYAIITDPVFSTRAGLHLGPVTLGVKRLVEPALKIPELPKIDLVVLSHAHMDHFDIPSLRRLENRATAVVTASRTGDLLRAGQYAEVHEIGWGEEQRIGPATLKAIEVNHWAPGFAPTPIGDTTDMSFKSAGSGFCLPATRPTPANSLASRVLSVST